jgi:hypothetical protein
MRTEKRRADKYEKKIDGNVVKSRIESYGEKQKSYFKSYAIEQAKAEEIVKSFLVGKVPTNMLIYYIVFAKEILDLKYKHEGKILEKEAFLTAKKWNSRGLDFILLAEIAARLGVYICIPGIDQYTVSLIHFDGPEGSKSIVDELGTIWYVGGDAHITNQTYRFPSGSVAFGGVGDFLLANPNDNFLFFSLDFCIECWYKRLNLTGWGVIVSFADAGGTCSYRISQGWDGKIYVDLNTTAGFYYITSSSAINDFGWHHIALCRNGPVVTLYIDGKNNGSVNIGTLMLKFVAGRLAISRDGLAARGWLPGYIDEFRVSRGTPRWTSDFFPPTRPYC